MADLVFIIKTIMKCQKSDVKVDVTLSNSEQYTGYITKYTGQILFIDGTEIPINDIEFIKEHEDIDLSEYVMSRVLIITLSGEQIDAVLINYQDDHINIINDQGQQSIALDAVEKIVCDNHEIVFNEKIHYENQIMSPDAEQEKIDNNIPYGSDLDQFDSGEKKPKESIDKPYSPNDFEQALISGNKSQVGYFVAHGNKLSNLGYTDQEIKKIQKNYGAVTWGMDPFRVATRIEYMQANKNGLAKIYYEKAFNCTKKTSPDYKKILHALMRYVREDGDESYVRFWEKNKKYLKDNKEYCSQYIDTQLKIQGIKVNEFEKILMGGEKALAEEFVQNRENLVELGYSDNDIERIGKAIKFVNWETNWYKTAARLFAMQLNKNQLAEVFYEAALLITDRKSDEYIKILNALASIKMHEGSETYITFFKTYKDKLKTNANYCIAYANALLSTQNLSQIENDMPMLQEQLAVNPVYLERLQTEIDYYKIAPLFELSKMKILSERYQNDEKLYDQEKGLLEKLPERNALKTLLEIYFFQKEEQAYFELADYALFYIKEDKNAMLKLYSMMQSTEDMSNIVHFLPKVPVLWCDEDLVKKYLKNRVEKSDAEYTQEEVWLENHINSAGEYRNLNAFEIGIINKDYEEVRKYIDNLYLLEELGYSEGEIEDISDTDFEAQLSDDIYSMRRVLAFQGNKDHIAERYLFEAYYENKIDMCNRLFPLLIEEKRGELIIALFNFDDKLKSNIISLRRFYYLALCMVEKDDNVFFSCVESEWMNYPEDEILDRMILIAKNRNDDFLLKQLEVQKNRPRGNEFENAVILSENETIRKYVKNANLLVELGYTPEEIQKINKIFALGTTNAGTKPGQIANRVYLYQKNKNSLAERLYLNALAEDSPEDRINDCKALFQIYTAQHNYEMVCNIFEKYLYKEMENKFNKTYASTYCIALFELERYKAFLDFVRKNKDKWEGFTLSANLLYVADKVGTHEFDDFIWEHLNSSTYRPDIISKYIISVLEKNKEYVYTEEFADLFNLFFAHLPDNDIVDITNKLKNTSSDRFMKPKASILAALADCDNCEQYISDWLSYVIVGSDENKKIDIIIKLGEVFPRETQYLLTYAIELYTKIIDGRVTEYKICMFEDYIYQYVNNTSLCEKWCDLQSTILSEGKGSLHSLENFLKIVKMLNLPEKFWEVYLEYKKNSTTEVPSQKLFEIIIDFYDFAVGVMDNEWKRSVVDELIFLSGEFPLDYVNCKKIAEICAECGKLFESNIYMVTLGKLIQSDSECIEQTVESIDEKNIDYIGYLRKMLIDDTHTDLAKKCSGWSKYVVISEEDELIIERLRNTISTAELWVSEEVNILAKVIICDPQNAVYWKLFKSWLLQTSDKDETILGAILFQLSSQGDKETASALDYAVSNDLKVIALELMMKMLDLKMPDLNIAAQKNMRVMIDKGWFDEDIFKAKAQEIIKKIALNASLKESLDYVWNSVSAAIDLAVATCEYEILISSFQNYLSRECAKQCCVIIANMILNNQDDCIQKAFKCLDSSISDVPYKKLVHDLYDSSKSRKLLESEKEALKCIQLDCGNTLGVKEVLGFYCDMCVSKQSQIGFDTIRLLMEYTPNDPVLSEVAACFLKEATNQEKTSYYEYLYEYLEPSQSEIPVEYAVGQMVCGEVYLREKEGKVVESFKKFIEDRYPKYTKKSQEYGRFCDTLIVNLRPTENEQFAYVLVNAVFTGNWVDVLEYKPFDDEINRILSDNIKTDTINIVDDYYRSIIKSIAIYVLNHNDNEGDSVDYDRIGILWNNMGNVGCSYGFFCGLLHDVSEECVEELKSIWALDIETLTVFKKFFGKCILKQVHCTQYVNVFTVFINARSATDIFNNSETQELLKTLDKEKAIEICKAYEQLYIHSSDQGMKREKGKSANENSDYENNIFSNYLKKNLGKEYYSISSRYERFKKKYKLILKLNNISSYGEANSKNRSIYMRWQIFSLRALYFYYSVLNGSVEDKEFSDHRYADIINAITVALSDDTYLLELNSFITKFSPEVRNVLGILLLSEQEKLDKAAETVINKITGKWKGYLCARLVATYGTNRQTNKWCERCLEISKNSSIENCFWVKNHKHANSIYKLEPEKYITEIVHEDSIKGDVSEVDGISDNVSDMSKDTVLDEIIDEQKISADIEELSFEVPDFVKEFMETVYNEKVFCDLQTQWNELKNSVENGNGTQESLNDCAIRIGITLLKNQNKNLDEKIMAEIFALVRRYSIQDSYIISALHDLLQNYITGYSDLDLLARSVYENRNEIQHLCYEQNIEHKPRIAEDIKAAAILINILIEIANDLSSGMGDESIKERLRSYQDDLYAKTKKISKFRVSVNALEKMIREKINRINYVPYLVVSHLGTVSADNNKNYNWKEIWMEGASHGAVRGVVLNRGGAPAKKVILSVMVNSELRETYTIGEIGPGKKLPFVVEYGKSDVLNGTVNWSANATYRDESNEKNLTSNGYGKIHVSITSEEWGASHVGREKFNTQFAAEGDEFCGRKNELLKLNNLYNISTDVSRYPSLLVMGLRRAGKTSVIKYFKESLKERSGLAPIFVDAQGINGDITNAFFNLVFNELYRCYRKEMEGFVDFKNRWTKISKEDDWIGQLPTYFMELSELLGNRKVIFVLDEMENVFYANHFPSAQSEEQFFGMIRSIIQNYQEYVSFIFCGSDKLLTSCLEQKRESQMFQVLQRIYVGRMGINDIRDMFDKYNSVYDIKFGDDAIDAIMYYTGGLIWYTKVIAYNILDQIIDQERIVRDEIHVSDVDYIVEKLISGDLGSELIDLLDNNFGAKRKAIIRAMAKATKHPNDSVSVDMICAELSRLNYIDNETGEVLGTISEEDMNKNLGVLEKMDFIEKDSRKEKAYRFTTELYRLLMLDDRKIDKFVIFNGGECDGK